MALTGFDRKSLSGPTLGMSPCGKLTPEVLPSHLLHHLPGVSLSSIFSFFFKQWPLVGKLKRDLAVFLSDLSATSPPGNPHRAMPKSPHGTRWDPTAPGPPGRFLVAQEPLPIAPKALERENRARRPRQPAPRGVEACRSPLPWRRPSWAAGCGTAPAPCPSEEPRSLRGAPRGKTGQNGAKRGEKGKRERPKPPARAAFPKNQPPAPPLAARARPHRSPPPPSAARPPAAAAHRPHPPGGSARPRRQRAAAACCSRPPFRLSGPPGAL